MIWTVARRAYKATLIATVLTSSLPHANAAILYSQDFESTTPGVVATPGGSAVFYSSVNLGFVWEYTASGGAGGSKGLTLRFNSTNSPSFAGGSIDGYRPTASDANPLGNGLVHDPSQINFAFDVKVIGNLTSQPLGISVAQVDPTYESDRGIDANGDGDMRDSATVYRSFNTPMLIEGQYVHVSFTLDQGQINADMLKETSTSLTRIPLTPQFDPTVGLSWSLSFQAFDDFGFDSGNSISIDNIEFTSVPEPTSVVLLVVAVYGIAVRRSRSFFSPAVP